MKQGHKEITSYKVKQEKQMTSINSFRMKLVFLSTVRIQIR